LAYLHVLFQTLLAFGTILVLTIILGKQQISELTYFEYINGITFGSIAAALATDIDSETGLHFFGLVLFGGLTFLMSFLTLKSRWAKKLLEGDPVIVIRDGKILENNLRKSRFNVDQILQLLREKDVFDVSQVQFAILENDGSISVMRKPEHQQLTPKSLSQPPKNHPQVPMELVVDGQIIYKNLRKMGKTGRWLMEELKKRQVTSLRDVFYVSLESDGTLYVDRRRDF
jgi:uncharacterized membrane protein YcaP (DUF421 family)